VRTAIVTDIHGNREAFEAVVRDLRETSPDLILHGGDLAGSGSSSASIIDRIRELGWPGVYGNTDEMLFRPTSLDDFAGNRMPQMFAAIAEMAAWDRDQVGAERIGWLSKLPGSYLNDGFVLLHASPQSAWLAPGQGADEAELESTFAPLGRALVVYGHIHHPYIRKMRSRTVVNAGSVSLSFDGDPRASYVLVDDFVPSIRRVEYDVNREIEALLASGMPHAAWVAETLRSAAPQAFRADWGHE
jgi:putative phosphoesterase